MSSGTSALDEMLPAFKLLKSRYTIVLAVQVGRVPVGVRGGETRCGHVVCASVQKLPCIYHQIVQRLENNLRFCP